MSFDFTLSKYGELLSIVKECGYEFFTISGWLKNSPGKGVIIRHDVDRRAENSLKTAKLEKDFGIKATYYFRMTRGSFKEDIIRKIAGMGHEIGYHYEDYTTFRGDISKSIESFRKNLARFREITEIKTIAMHGKPVSKYNNLDMWDKIEYGDFDLEGEAYLTIDYGGIYYFSDTGRSWKRASRSNFKDYTGGLNSGNIRTTDELNEFIKNFMPERLAIMTHPERWNSNAPGYIFYFFRDKTINILKSVFSLFRNKGFKAGEII